MKPYIFITIIIALGMTMLPGCDDLTTQPPSPAEYDVLFVNLPTETRCVANQQLDIPIQVVVRAKTDGTPAKDVRVEFFVASGTGSFPAPVVTTNAEGKAEGVLRLTPVRGANAVNVKALVTGGSVEGTISMIGITLPVEIVLMVTPNPLQVPQGANGTAAIYATVLDSSRSPVAGARLSFHLSGHEGNPPFGAIDSNGFNTLGGFGTEWIVATVTEAEMEFSLSDSVLMTVQRVSTPAFLSMSVIPNPLIVPLGVDGMAQIYLTVLDSSRSPVGGDWDISYRLQSDNGNPVFGAISDRGVFHTLSYYGTEWIVATVTVPELGIAISYEVLITVLRDTQGIASITLTADPDTLILYDDESGEVMLRAEVLDEDGNGIENVHVNFVTDLGAIVSVTATNADGIATALVNNQWEEGTAHFLAEIPGTDLEAEATVFIKYVRSPTQISLTSSKNQMTVASGDSAVLQATARFEDGSYAPAGTVIQFEVSNGNGRFSSNAVPVTQLGRAETQYIAGNLLGVVSIRAFWADEDTTVFSNTVEIQLLPGPPGHITLTADPDTLLTGDPGAFSTVIATVTDANDNPTQLGTLVRFTTSHGDISPTALTNELGRATARLTPGVMAGSAWIAASVGSGENMISDTLWIVFEAGGPNSIELTAQPLAIPVGSNATLTAIVRDGNGNNIQESVAVVFLVMNGNANGPHFPNGQTVDSARTANGRAVISLNAGQQLGGLLLKAYTWKDPETRQDTISALSSVVQVVSGAPATISIGVNDDGDDAGGGTWEIPVSAWVVDRFGNPVTGRVPVSFTIEPDDAGTIDPGFTGNDIGSGSTPGVAFTWLRYHSLKTFEPVTIRAEVQVQGGVISAELEHILPLQDGQLTINVDPEQWDFDRGRPEDTCEIRCSVLLTDGHGIEINNAPILLRSDRARFYWRDGNGPFRPFPNEVVRIFTGGRPDVAFLRGRMSDFYLDDFTLEVTVHIEASVEGYDVSASQTIDVNRH